MTAPEPLHSSNPLRLQNFWGRMLLPLLLSLASLILGWHLSEQGHSRLASASQTVPVLPELRPASSPQPSVQGVGTVPEPLPAAPLVRWHGAVLQLGASWGSVSTDLLVLGRMNLDGG